MTQVFSAAVLSLSDSWSQHRPFTSTHANLQASDLEATVVVLGGVVGARDHGALGPRLGAAGGHVDAGAGDVPEVGELRKEPMSHK